MMIIMTMVGMLSSIVVWSSTRVCSARIVMRIMIMVVVGMVVVGIAAVARGAVIMKAVMAVAAVIAALARRRQPGNRWFGELPSVMSRIKRVLLRTRRSR